MAGSNWKPSELKRRKETSCTPVSALTAEHFRTSPTIKWVGADTWTCTFKTKATATSKSLMCSNCKMSSINFRKKLRVKLTFNWTCKSRDRWTLATCELFNQVRFRKLPSSCKIVRWRVISQDFCLFSNVRVWKPWETIHLCKVKRLG